MRVLEPGIVAEMRLAKVGRILEATAAEFRIAVKFRLREMGRTRKVSPCEPDIAPEPAALEVGATPDNGASPFGGPIPAGVREFGVAIEPALLERRSRPREAGAGEVRVAAEMRGGEPSLTLEAAIAERARGWKEKAMELGVGVEAGAREIRHRRIRDKAGLGARSSVQGKPLHRLGPAVPNRRTLACAAQCGLAPGSLRAVVDLPEVVAANASYQGFKATRARLAAPRRRISDATCGLTPLRDP